MCGMATWHGGTVIDDIVPGTPERAPISDSPR